MNMGEVKEHLIKDCDNVEVECHKCFKGLKKRKDFIKHSPETCIKTLQSTLEINLRELKTLKRQKIKNDSEFQPILPDFLRDMS